MNSKIDDAHEFLYHAICFTWTMIQFAVPLTLVAGILVFAMLRFVVRVVWGGWCNGQKAETTKTWAVCAADAT